MRNDILSSVDRWVEFLEEVGGGRETRFETEGRGRRGKREPEVDRLTKQEGGHLSTFTGPCLSERGLA